MEKMNSMSVDDIRRLREEEYEKTKNKSMSEYLDYIEEKARPGMEELKRRRAEKEAKDRKEN